MNGKGKFRRSLALVLALAMVISVTGGTLADGAGDIYVTDETRTVNGDVNGIADAYANEGETASLTVTGTVTNTDNTAVYAGTENGSVTVKTGDVTAEDPEGDQYINAVGAYTRGEKAEADVTVGDIQSDDSGATASNNGGEITMTTGDIEATQKGVELFDAAYLENEGITAEEFAALGLKTASNIQVYDPDSSYTIRQEEYVAEDSTHYYHYVYSDGTESYSKEGPKKTGTGSTEVTTGSISVSNEGRWTQGASVNNQSEGKTSSLTVNGNITATSGSEDFSSGIEVYVTEGNGSAVVNGDVSVTGNQVSAVHAYSENGNADLTVNGNITAEAASGSAIEVDAGGDGKATVQAGNIKTVGMEESEGTAVMIISEDKDAEAAVTTGNITAAGPGVNIINRGGRHRSLHRIDPVGRIRNKHREPAGRQLWHGYFLPGGSGQQQNSRQHGSL